MISIPSYVAAFMNSYLMTRILLTAEVMGTNLLSAAPIYGTVQCTECHKRII